MKHLAVIETLKHVKKFSGHTLLIKLGGSILDNPALVEQLCQDIVLLRAAGLKLVIVHGGGKAINQALQEKGLSWDFYQGQRITSKAMINVIEMVLSGQVNRQLVRLLNSLGVNALGMSGCDRQLLSCERSHPQLGEVGTIKQVSPHLIVTCLTEQQQDIAGCIPVIASIGVDNAGNPLNVNADYAAAAIALALHANKLIYLSDQDGILDAQGRLLSSLTIAELQQLIHQQVVTQGMQVKTESIINALTHGIQQVHVINAKIPHALLTELFTEQGIGTVCYV